jgi:predicted MPP superfamily phosphohydrolase
MTSMFFAAFVFVFSAVLFGMHGYGWLRLIHDSALEPGLTTTLGQCWLALAVACPLSIFSDRLLPRPLAAVVVRLGYVWFGLLTLLSCVLLVTEPVRYALVAGGVDVVSVARALSVSSIVGVGLLLGFGVVRAFTVPAVKRVPLALAAFPEALSGFRIVQISDLHIGPTLGREWLQQVVARVNDSQPDLIVITGDLVDGSVERLGPQVEPLRDLRAVHGVYFVTGNHEYYSGADAWLAALGKLGVTALRNERVSIGDGAASFDLAGVDDWHAFGHGHGRDLQRALSGQSPARATVLLAHQPKQIHEAAEHGVMLQLSGHTHGGQIFPFHFFVRLQQPFIAGVHRVKDTVLYISRGTGFWGPPVRLGAPPEITLLELSRAR